MADYMYETKENLLFNHGDAPWRRATRDAAARDLMNPTLLRLLIVVGLAMASFVGFRLWKAWSLRRSTRRVRAMGETGQVSLMYFSGPNCAQCSAQEAVIREVEALQPTVEFTAYDASIDVVVASRVGVMSVPTTVVLDDTGRVRARNGRFVKADVLLTQIKAAQGSPVS